MGDGCWTWERWVIKVLVFNIKICVSTCFKKHGILVKIIVTCLLSFRCWWKPSCKGEIPPYCPRNFAVRACPGCQFSEVPLKMGWINPVVIWATGHEFECLFLGETKRGKKLNFSSVFWGWQVEICVWVTDKHKPGSSPVFSLSSRTAWHLVMADLLTGFDLHLLS